MTFDPKDHLIDLKGKPYLQVQHRVLWFRSEHPNGAIVTELLSTAPVIVKATVYDSEGHVIATGHGSATPKANAIWSGRELEKAETAATGRALGLAGYGTQFTDEFNDAEDGHLADSPVQSLTKPPKHGERMNVILSGLIVKQDDGNPYLVFNVKQASIKAYAHTRQLFREAGYEDCETWEQVGVKYATTPMNAVIQFTAAKKDGDWSGWTVVQVAANLERKAQSA